MREGLIAIRTAAYRLRRIIGLLNLDVNEASMEDLDKLEEAVRQLRDVVTKRWLGEEVDDYSNPAQIRGVGAE